MFKRLTAALLLSGMVFAVPPVTALADQHELCGIDLTNAHADAAITGEVAMVGFVVGVRWGTGELILNNGERRAFQIIGGKALETGVSENVITGEVYNLKDINDFEGLYYGASAKITIAKGEGEAVVNNSNCVVVKARAVGHGLQLSAPGPSGVEVRFID